MKYIDSHAHYLARQFSKDRDLLLKNLFNNDLEIIIECGTNPKGNAAVVDMCEKYDKIFGVIGFFPTNAIDLSIPQNKQTLIEQLKHPKIVGLGEIGLDYYHDREGAKTQQKYFVEQLQIAKEMNLPVCIHSREAEDDTVAILRNFGKNHGVIHCYAYGPKTMNKLLELGYYFGVGGTSTYLQNVLLRDAIREMPMERIVLETDAPYLAPSKVPLKMRRNDSFNIKYVIENLADLKGISTDEVIKITNENVLRLYPKINKYLSEFKA